MYFAYNKSFTASCFILGRCLPALMYIQTWQGDNMFLITLPDMIGQCNIHLPRSEEKLTSESQDDTGRLLLIPVSKICF